MSEGELLHHTTMCSCNIVCVCVHAHKHSVKCLRNTKSGESTLSHWSRIFTRLFAAEIIWGDDRLPRRAGVVIRWAKNSCWDSWSWTPAQISSFAIAFQCNIVVIKNKCLLGCYALSLLTLAFQREKKTSTRLLHAVTFDFCLSTRGFCR